MLDLNTLNPPQRQAVEQTEGALIILAGAGTGKTRVISYRIAHMVAKGYDPQSIVAMTFTNKAAREMRERISALCGPRAKGLHVGTFHSFCLAILRRYTKYTDLDAKFTLIGTSEQLEFVRRAIDENGWSGLYQPPILLERIGRCKNLLLCPHDLGSDHCGSLGLGEGDVRVLKLVYTHYQRQLRLNRVIDFDDCIFEFIKLLKTHDEVRHKICSALRYFLVDEFQDTNFSQLEALKLLATSGNVCVVGDDDQSIYSWRGAEPKILELFESHFPGSRLIKLEQNYRCSNVILGAANRVIANNRSRKVKVLWSDSRKNDPIIVAGHMDEMAEARWIAQKCISFLGQGRKLEDIGILYRTKSQAKAFEVALRESGLKYKVFGGTSFFEKKEIKDFLAYFKLSLNPNHRLSYWRIINTPSRGIGLKTQEIIEEAAKAKDLSPFESVGQIMPDLPKLAQKGLTELNEILLRLSHDPVSSPDQVRRRGHEIIDAFKLENDIRLNAKNDKSRQRKLENLRKLPDWLKALAENCEKDETEPFSADALIDQLALTDEGKPTDDKDPPSRISLMTIHGAKGLEFPVVFLPGIEDDILPHKNSDSPQAIDEERRLFYVAITRAKQNLFMSFAAKRNTGFQQNTKKPSRFLKELPEKGILVETEIAAELDPEEKRIHNINRLSQLKDRLKSGFKHQ